MLLVAAFIWGTAFVAQKIGGDIGTFTYNGIRMTIGGLVLIPVALISDRGSVAKAAYSEKSPEEKAKARRILILGGIALFYKSYAVIKYTVIISSDIFVIH